MKLDNSQNIRDSHNIDSTDLSSELWVFWHLIPTSQGQKCTWIPSLSQMQRWCIWLWWNHRAKFFEMSKEKPSLLYYLFRDTASTLNLITVCCTKQHRWKSL